MNEDFKKNYPWLEKLNSEQFLKLWNINDEDVSFHCNNCNTNVEIVYMDDYCCPYCKAPKSSLSLIETQDYYKNRMEDSDNFLEFWYFCKDCKHAFDHKDYIVNSLLCPECNSSDIIKYKNIMELEEKQKVDVTKLYCKECHEPYTMAELEQNMMCCPHCSCQIEDSEEEQEYTCKECYETFTSNLTKNIKCPNCGRVYESLDPIDLEDRELDLQINDEDWEDL